VVVPGLSLEEQIKMHESEALRCEHLCIVNTSPETIDNRLCGEMISISYAREYDKNFTKKQFPHRVLPKWYNAVSFPLPYQLSFHRAFS